MRLWVNVARQMWRHLWKSTLVGEEKPAAGINASSSGKCQQIDFSGIAAWWSQNELKFVKIFRTFGCHRSYFSLQVSQALLQMGECVGFRFIDLWMTILIYLQILCDYRPRYSKSWRTLMKLYEWILTYMLYKTQSYVQPLHTHSHTRLSSFNHYRAIQLSVVKTDLC